MRGKIGFLPSLQGSKRAESNSLVAGSHLSYFCGVKPKKKIVDILRGNKTGKETKDITKASSVDPAICIQFTELLCLFMSHGMCKANS